MLLPERESVRKSFILVYALVFRPMAFNEPPPKPRMHAIPQERHASPQCSHQNSGGRSARRLGRTAKPSPGMRAHVANQRPQRSRPSCPRVHATNVSACCTTTSFADRIPFVRRRVAGNNALLKTDSTRCSAVRGR